MRTEAFYVTAAQILPTILVAIMIEFSVILRGVGIAETLSGIPLRIMESVPPAMLRELQRKLRRRRRWLGPTITAMVVAAASFVIGEVAALLTIFFGTGGWLPWVSAPVVWLAALVMVLSGVAAPIGRFAVEIVVMEEYGLDPNDSGSFLSDDAKGTADSDLESIELFRRVEQARRKPDAPQSD